MWEQVLYPELPGILAYVCITKSLGPLCAPLTSQWFSSSHSPVVWPLSHFLHHLACVSSLISSLTVSSSLAKVTLSSLGNGWPSAFDRPLIGYEYPRRKCWPTPRPPSFPAYIAIARTLHLTVTPRRVPRSPPTLTSQILVEAVPVTEADSDSSSSASSSSWHILQLARRWRPPPLLLLLERLVLPARIPSTASSPLLMPSLSTLSLVVRFPTLHQRSILSPSSPLESTTHSLMLPPIRMLLCNRAVFTYPVLVRPGPTPVELRSRKRWIWVWTRIWLLVLKRMAQVL